MVSGHLNGKPMKTLQSSQPRLGANEPSSLISIQVGILSKYFPAADDGALRAAAAGVSARRVGSRLIKAYRSSKVGNLGVPCVDLDAIKDSALGMVDLNTFRQFAVQRPGGKHMSRSAGSTGLLGISGVT
ncbi:hypothetical protein F4824DRAFT_498474 [Ustulina deusta]|nr:hypothetical protein F4824DRAFT_498474 [Ustulina deusta]